MPGTGPATTLENREATMPRPEMMAVGDSIYNGVRSLTIDATLAAHSVPVQVAAAFGWEFVVADYPRVMLADIEKVFRDPLAGAASLVRNAAVNAHAWLADQRWSRQNVFHNLAVAQMQVRDVYTANYSDSIKIASDLATLGAALPIRELPSLYQALNTAFILNPGRQADDRCTPVDILSAEKPKRILINIGINDGLWKLLLMADPTDYETRINPIPDMRTLALHLKESCPDTEHFYINLYPKPSCIANLMPPPAGDPPPIPTNHYYDKYIGHLLGNGGIPHDKMREIDTWVRDTLNPRIKDALSPLNPRVHFIDLYTSLQAYDRKNWFFDKQVQVRRGGTPILLENHALAVTPFGGLADNGGGLFGLDNLHPTIVGYGLIAQAVCDVIAATEGATAPSIDLQKCYDADSLLHNLPASIALADFALELVSTFLGGGGLGAIA
jgi:lysophospholipase L1-like esterase